MSPRKTAPVRTLALAYCRVSTDDQAENGASLAAQTAALTAEAERRGWDVEIVVEGLSGKDLHRPALQAALERLDRGDAQVLMSIRLDRVSRSVADFSGLMARGRKRGWRIVLQSPALDTEDPSGKFVTHVLAAAAAEYERDLISTRTREGMAQRRAEGVHCGRPRALPLDVVQRIVDARGEGDSMRAIAAQLTADGIPTARGGQAWSASTVQGVLESTTGRALADA